MKHNTIDMDPIEIRVELTRNKVTQASIARAMGVTNSAINRVIDGVFVSHRIRRAIADAIKTDINRIWPSTYILGGGPRGRGRPPKQKPSNTNQ